MNRIERPSILEANILYVILGLLLWFGGSIVQSREIYSGLLITEYIILLIPNLIYLKLMGFSLKKVLRLNKISLKQIKYVVFITIFSYPIAVFFNFIMTFFLTSFGKTLAEPIPMADTPSMYFISLFVIALAPGICEEVMFRGTIMSAYGNLGKRRAITYSAILFGIFHLNLQNLLGPIFLGIILGITVYKTNSLYASIIGHTLSNAIAVTIGYYSTKAMGDINQLEVQALEIPNSLQMLILLGFLALIALISASILMRLIKNMPESRKTELEEPIYRPSRIIDYLPLLVIFALFIYINLNVFFL